VLFKWIDFKITNRCNNHCTYCGVSHDSPLADEKIPAEKLAQVVKDAKSCGFTHFAFLGGEPSVRQDFPKIVEPLQSYPEVDTVMAITNMLIFNETLYRAIFETKSKTAQIVASIDSLQEPNYKHQRVCQTLDYALRIQEIAKEYSALGKREVQVHSVISRENFDKLFPLVDFFAQKNMGVSLAVVEPFKITESVTGNPDYNVFTIYDIELVIEQLDGLEKCGLLNWANKVTRDYLKQVITGDVEGLAECTAGKAHVIIDSLGDVYPCLTEAYQRGLNYGNISNQTFKQIYQAMAGFHCENIYQQTCWDHLLWTKLEKVVNNHREVGTSDDPT
jgi:MoaA/NifB/PqqE/SkfB family radical SAM enzyme